MNPIARLQSKYATTVIRYFATTVICYFDAIISHTILCRRQPSSFLERTVLEALQNPNLQANLEYYKTHDPDPNNQLEVSYAARLSKLRGMISELQGDSKFLNKQLSGFDQCEMDVVDIVGSQFWSTLVKRLTRALYFFYNNQVVVYHEGAILQKDKHGLLSLVLPIAGFAHQTNVHVDNHLDTQLTVSWFDESSTDAASALFALIQLALVCQSDDIDKGSETPPLVQVEVPAEGNERATIVLSPDQFSKLTELSGCDACDHLIEFKKVVFTAKQQAGLLKTAGQIKLTDCVFVGDGQALSETLEMGANDLVLWQLKLYEKFPFGTGQALILIKSCNKSIVIGGGAAVDLFKQECLMARLKEKAASDGLFYSWKFDFGTFSSSEKELFRDFLAEIYTRKLGLLEDHATFAATKVRSFNNCRRRMTRTIPTVKLTTGLLIWWISCLARSTKWNSPAT